MSKKQGNGDGNIRQRPDGRWEGRYHLEIDGVVKRRSVFGKTRQEASQALRVALKSRDDGGIPLATGRQTISTFLAYWLTTVKPNVRVRTLVSYDQIVRTHIDPKLGPITLKRLQPIQVQKFYAGLSESGSSAKTVRNVHGVLHRALDQAVRWRLIPFNVADMVDPPRRQQHEMKSLNAEEAQRVLAAAQEDDLEALWWLALTAGMRQGELLALRWPNVDLDDATVQVVASSVRLGKQARSLVGWAEDGDHQRLGEPKSRRSRRKIELSRPAVEALRRQRQKVMEAALAAGRPFDRNGYVFSRVDGQALAVTTTWKLWGRLLKKAEVPYVRFHDARHTAATLLLSKGVHPKVVSEMLGHSTVAITLDVYSHVTASMHKEAAKVMDGIFG